MPLEYKQLKIKFAFGANQYDVTDFVPDIFAAKINLSYEDKAGRINYGKFNVKLLNDGRFSPDDDEYLFSGLGVDMKPLFCEIYSNGKMLWRGLTYSSPSYEETIDNNTYVNEAVFSFYHKIEELKNIKFSACGDPVPSFDKALNLLDDIAEQIGYTVSGKDFYIKRDEKWTASQWSLFDRTLSKSHDAKDCLEHPDYPGCFFGYDGESVNLYCTAGAIPILYIGDEYNVVKFWWNGGYLYGLVAPCGDVDYEEQGQAFIFKNEVTVNPNLTSSFLNTQLATANNILDAVCFAAQSHVKHKSNKLYFAERLSAEEANDVNAIVGVYDVIGITNPIIKDRMVDRHVNFYNQLTIVEAFAPGVGNPWNRFRCEYRYMYPSWGVRLWDDILECSRQDFLDKGKNPFPIYSTVGPSWYRNKISNRAETLLDISQMGKPIYIPYPVNVSIESFTTSGELEEPRVICASVDPYSYSKNIDFCLLREANEYYDRRPPSHASDGSIYRVGRAPYSPTAEVSPDGLLPGYWAFSTKNSPVQIEYTEGEIEEMEETRWMREAFEWLNLEDAHNIKGYYVRVPPFDKTVSSFESNDSILLTLGKGDSYGVYRFTYSSGELERVFPNNHVCPVTGEHLCDIEIANIKIVDNNHCVASYHPYRKSDFEGINTCHNCIVSFELTDEIVRGVVELDARDVYGTSLENDNIASIELLDATIHENEIHIAVKEHVFCEERIQNVENTFRKYWESDTWNLSRFYLHSSFWEDEPEHIELTMDYDYPIIATFGDITKHLKAGDFFRIKPSRKNFNVFGLFGGKYTPPTFREVVSAQYGFSDWSDNDSRLEFRPIVELAYLADGRHSWIERPGTFEHSRIHLPPTSGLILNQAREVWSDWSASINKVGLKTVVKCKVYCGGTEQFVNTSGVDKSSDRKEQFEELKIQQEDGQVFAELNNVYYSGLEFYNRWNVRIYPEYIVEEALGRLEGKTKIVFTSHLPYDKIKVKYYYYNAGSIRFVGADYVAVANDSGGVDLYDFDYSFIDTVNYAADTVNCVRIDSNGDYYGIHSHNNRLWRHRERNLIFFGNLVKLQETDCFSVFQQILNACKLIAIPDDLNKKFIIVDSSREASKGFSRDSIFVKRGDINKFPGGLYVFTWAGGDIPINRAVSSDVKHMQTKSSGNKLIDALGWAHSMADIEYEQIFNPFRKVYYTFAGVRDDFTLTSPGLFMINMDFKKQSTEVGVYHA